MSFGLLRFDARMGDTNHVEHRAAQTLASIVPRKLDASFWLTYLEKLPGFRFSKRGGQVVWSDYFENVHRSAEIVSGVGESLQQDCNVVSHVGFMKLSGLAMFRLHDPGRCSLGVED